MIKNLPVNAGDAGDVGSILSQEDPLEEENATHSNILAWVNSRDKCAWQAIVHGVTKSQIQLSQHAHTEHSH